MHARTCSAWPSRGSVGRAAPTATGWPIVVTTAGLHRPGTRGRAATCHVWTRPGPSGKLELPRASPQPPRRLPSARAALSPHRVGSLPLPATIWEARIMGDKAHAHTGAAGRAATAGRPSSVRNVVLVGHSGSGKTTLVEALAQTAGAVNRAGRVEDGGTISDYDEIEHRQQRSVQLSLVPVEWDGYKINLLDTPGYADFVGELRAGLRAADAALFVVSASDGVDGSTRMLWEECAAVGMPRAIVVTHLESARSDFEEMTAVCAQAFGGDDPDAVLPLYLPLRGPQAPDGHAPVTGLTGLLSQKLFDYSSGERKESEPGEDQLPEIEE